MQNNLYKYLAIVFAIIAVVLLAVVMRPSNSPVGGSQQEWNVFSTTATSGPISLTATQIQILATSSDRRYVTFRPQPACTQGFHISLLNDIAATANNSIFVQASSTGYTIDTGNLYTGAVRGLSNGGTCVITVTAK